MKKTKRFFLSLIIGSALLMEGQLVSASDTNIFVDGVNEFSEGEVYSQKKEQVEDDSSGVFDDGTALTEGNSENYQVTTREYSENLYGYFFYADYEDDRYIEILEYAGKEENVTIPSEINGKPVISIGEKAFKHSDSTVVVNIPNSVKYIGYQAFADCEKLQSVKGLGVEKIYSEAFSGCSELEYVDFPNVIEIRYFAFFATGMDTVNFPKLESLGTKVFYRSGLREFSLGKIKTIPEGTFSFCKNLTKIDLPDVTTVDTDTFYECDLLEYVNIPKLQNIGSKGFYKCKSLTQINFPNLIEIGNGAFEGDNKLQSVVWGSKLKTIGDYAFKDCQELKKINIPDTVQKIGGYSFGYFGKSWSLEKVEDFTIHCGPGTEGNIYAVRNEFPFEFHNYETIIKPATLTEYGTIDNVCSICGLHEMDTVEIPSISYCELTQTEFRYNGNVQKPKVEIYNDYGQMLDQADYSVSYSGESIEVGEYEATITFSGLYSGVCTKSYRIIENKPEIFASNMITSVGTSGKSLNVKIIGDGGKVSYKSSNPKIASVSSSGKITAKNVGTVTITVTVGKTESYPAISKKIMVNVIPKKPVLSKVAESSKGKLKLTWKTDKNVSGYVIYRATSKSGTYKKIKTVQGNKTSSYINSGLKNGKTYYYKIRTYKKVGNKNIYSNYSSVKAGKTKEYKVSVVGVYKMSYPENVNVTVSKKSNYYSAKLYGRGGKMNTTVRLYQKGSGYIAYYEDGETFLMIDDIQTKKAYITFPLIIEFSGWYSRK